MKVILTTYGIGIVTELLKV